MSALSPNFLIKLGSSLYGDPLVQAHMSQRIFQSLFVKSGDVEHERGERRLGRESSVPNAPFASLT